MSGICWTPSYVRPILPKSPGRNKGRLDIVLLCCKTNRGLCFKLVELCFFLWSQQWGFYYVLYWIGRFSSQCRYYSTVQLHKSFRLLCYVTMLYINIIFYTLYLRKLVTEIANPPESLCDQDYRVCGGGTQVCASPDFSTTVMDSSQLPHCFFSHPVALICSLLYFSLSLSVFLLASPLTAFKMGYTGTCTFTFQ